MAKSANPGAGAALTRVPGFTQLSRAGEMGEFLVRIIRTLFARPFTWRRELAIQCSEIIRRCLLPGALSIAAFAIGLGTVYVGGIVKALGTTDRIGGGVYLGFVREPSTWVTTMIIAGVAGSAMTADLASRKIRDELDALSVLGVDQFRSLVMPRVVGITLMAPVIGLILVFVSTIVTFVCVTLLYKGFITPAGYVDAFRPFVQFPDLLILILKLFLAGLLVGVVSCYKGLSSGGGAEGVGRAVNQGVLICFFGVWMLNILTNTITLSLFPDLQVLRG